MSSQDNERRKGKDRRGEPRTRFDGKEPDRRDENTADDKRGKRKIQHMAVRPASYIPH